MKVRIPEALKSSGLSKNSDMSQIAKQAKQMQDKFEAAIKELENKKYESSSGGSMVKCVMNGKMKIESINIDKKIMDPNDISMLEDIITAAVNDAVDQVNADKEKTAESISGGKMSSSFF